MKTALNVIQIIISVALVTAIMFQVRGGGLGSIFGQGSTVFRTKRGLERTLFIVTIVLAVLFLATSIIMLRIV